jgi:hypothetical protein
MLVVPAAGATQAQPAHSLGSLAVILEQTTNDEKEGQN